MEPLFSKKASPVSTPKFFKQNINSIYTIQRQAIRQILNTPILQGKYKIDPVNSPAEKEADQLTDLVMSSSQEMNEPLHNIIETDPLVNRSLEDEEDLINTKSCTDNRLDSESSVGNEFQDLSGAGTSMSQEDQHHFGNLLGYDFSNVRIHTSEEGSKNAEAINAKAYTLGNDVVFGSGNYQPSSREGQRLLIHELIHVAQQNH
jgi:hypothetical protein